MSKDDRRFAFPPMMTDAEYEQLKQEVAGRRLALYPTTEDLRKRALFDSIPPPMTPEEIAARGREFMAEHALRMRAAEAESASRYRASRASGEPRKPWTPFPWTDLEERQNYRNSRINEKGLFLSIWMVSWEFWDMPLMAKAMLVSTACAVVEGGRWAERRHPRDLGLAIALGLFAWRCWAALKEHNRLVALDLARREAAWESENAPTKAEQ